jgi:hypothetical protein
VTRGSPRHRRISRVCNVGAAELDPAVLGRDLAGAQRPRLGFHVPAT